MKHVFVLFCCLFSQGILSQTAKNNAISFELGGGLSFYSLSYERTIVNVDGHDLSLKVGGMVLPYIFVLGGTQVEIKYGLDENSNRWNVGIGYRSFSMVGSKENTSAIYPCLYYRVPSKKDSGFLQLGVMGFIPLNEYKYGFPDSYPGYISVGYGLKF